MDMLQLITVVELVMVDEEVDQLEQLYVDMFMVIHCFLCFPVVGVPPGRATPIPVAGMAAD